MAGPFSGVRIIDISTVLMGPFATEQFADLGADVIKVETLDGDVIRNIGPNRHPGMSALYLNLNRNKRSIALDLKAPQGKAVLLKLIADADVLFYNIRPKAMARLGLSYEDVRSVNEKIIYCGAYGFSQDGPYAAKAAYDDLLQGAVGIADLTQQATGIASYAPFALADHACGMYAAFCLSAALFHKQVTGQGQSVEVPMFETMAQTILTHHMWGKAFDPPLAGTGFPRQISPNRRPFPTLDGHVCMLLVSDDQWLRFFSSVGLAATLEDQRFNTVAARNENTSELYAIVQQVLAQRTTAQWMELLEAHDLPASPMQSLDELMEDPHLRATGFFQKFEHPTEGSLVGMSVPSGWSVSATQEWRMPAPRIGENTKEILAKAGFSEVQIEELISIGVIAVPAQ